MPSYCYHLKFELYPTPDPTAKIGQSAVDDGRVWVPSRSSDIFDDLPAHPRARGAATSSPPRKRAARQRPRGAANSNTAAARSESLYTVPSAVIDCGSRRATVRDDSADRNVVLLSERQWRARSDSLPAPGFAAGIGPHTARRDWRFGPLRIESFDLETRGGMESGGQDRRRENNMPAVSTMEEVRGLAEAQAAPAASLGPNLGGSGQATKARYVPLETKNTEIGWGVVHLYRETDEPYALGGAPPPGRPSTTSRGTDGTGEGSASNADDDCTILCIPSVPSYLSPSDFLGFVGEKWRGDVSHYRMIMTSKMNRYMVLMKFRDGERARQWRKAFDGRVFNSIESEICHVTFIKSITVETPTRNSNNINNSNSTNNNGAGSNARPEDGDTTYGRTSSVAHSLKPFPPPTPNLIELPTCTVCLERMDDTAGLMTILCQHVFHCTCLQTWKGSGCPVCRATNPSLAATGSGSGAGSGSGYDAYDAESRHKQPFGTGVSNLCSVCDCTSDLWICLICGNVGCGRYKGGHAKDHWKETAHSFSLELETQHVWDYAGDTWVHRLIRDKGDGKVVELPSNDEGRPQQRRQRRPRRPSRFGDNREAYRGGYVEEEEDNEENYEEEDVVPRAKLDSIGMEYTHLLTSQLESQRVYFEEMVSKAADKAAAAAATAESASVQARAATAELSVLRAEHRVLREETVPSLERELERERGRAGKSAELARSLGRSLQEERKVGEGLMERIGHVNRELEALRAENAELKETNRDLTMFISGQEKLKELEGEGRVEQGELEGGRVSVSEEKKPGKGKGRKR